MSGYGKGGLPGGEVEDILGRQYGTSKAWREGWAIAHWENSSWTLLKLKLSAGEFGESRLKIWAGLGYREP